MTTKSNTDEQVLALLMEIMHTRNRSGLLNTSHTQQEIIPQPKKESVFKKIEMLSNQGLSARQIAKRIGVSRKAVKKHLERQNGGETK